MYDSIGELVNKHIFGVGGMTLELGTLEFGMMNRVESGFGIGGKDIRRNRIEGGLLGGIGLREDY